MVPGVLFQHSEPVLFVALWKSKALRYGEIIVNNDSPYRRNVIICFFQARKCKVKLVSMCFLWTLCCDDVWVSPIQLCTFTSGPRAEPECFPRSSFLFKYSDQFSEKEICACYLDDHYRSRYLKASGSPHIFAQKRGVLESSAEDSWRESNSPKNGTTDKVRLIAIVYYV